MVNFGGNETLKFSFFELMYVIVTADLELLEDVLNWVCIFFLF
jgi:hypothetical protein